MVSKNLNILKIGNCFTLKRRFTNFGINSVVDPFVTELDEYSEDDGYDSLFSSYESDEEEEEVEQENMSMTLPNTDNLS